MTPLESRAATPWNARDRRLLILLIVGGLIVQLPELMWGAPDGKAINNGLRILAGDVPYRDFWTMYAPGHFYLAAVLFKLFGVHVWVLSVAKQLLIAANAAALFLLIRRVGLPSHPALLVASAFMGMRWAFGPSLSSYETAFLFLIPAMNRAVAFAQGSNPSALVVAGILCGLGAWFKHDVAFYVTLGIVAGLSASWFLADRRPPNWVSPVGVLMRVGIGAAAGALPVVLFLAVKAGPDAWQDLIVFPATDFGVVRGEAYPGLLPAWGGVSPWLADPFDPVRAYATANYLSEWIQANIPQLVFVAAVIVLARIRRLAPPAALAAASICLAAMPLFWMSAHVQQNTNFMSLWLFSVLLGAIAWTATDRRGWARRTLVAAFLVHTGALLIGPIDSVARTVYFWKDHATLDFPSVAGIRISRERYEVLQPIVSFIRQNVPESEPIYSGLVRHDSIVISNQNFYYLSGRGVASRYNELHPGIADRPEVQREIIADLERLQVRCAVLWDFGWPPNYMNRILAQRQQRIPGIGATVLDEYFATHFDRVAQFREYILVWRKGVPMPPAPTVP